MEAKPNLTRIFLEHALVRVGGAVEVSDFEDQLRCAWEVGRAPWPQVAVPADVFVRHLAQRIPKESAGLPLERVLAQFTLSDLYFACACVHDVPASIEMLERHYMAKLPALLGRLNLSDMAIDDVCQSVRIHLLLGTSESGPQLAEYTGRGSLLNWIRVIAVRMALKQGGAVREKVLEENTIDALEAMPSSEGGTDLELIKRRHVPDFLQAMYEAFAELSDEQRKHLRLHYIERVSTTRMGMQLGKSQSVISRRLKTTRKVVRDGTKRRLKEWLELSSKEFTSLFDIIESQLDLSISQIFKKKE